MPRRYVAEIGCQKRATSVSYPMPPFAQQSESTPNRWSVLLRSAAVLTAIFGLSLAVVFWLPRRQLEPRTLSDLSDPIFDARGDGDVALVYLAQEMWGVWGKGGSTSRVTARYFLVTRRASDGRIIAERAIGEGTVDTRDGRPTILGVVDGMLWLQQDSVTRWRLPSLEPAPVASGERTSTDSILADLRTSAAFARSGMAKRWTDVRSARLVYARTPSLQSPADAFVIAHANDVPWRLADPDGWLAFVTAPDDVHRSDLLRVTDAEQMVWRTPLALDADAPFSVLDLGTHAVFQQWTGRTLHRRLDSGPGSPEPASVRLWSVDLATGAVTMYSVADQPSP